MHHAGLDALGLGQADQLAGVLVGFGDRLFGVDVLAGGDGLLDRLDARRGDEEVGVQRVVWVGEHRVEIGGVLETAVLFGGLLELGFVAADQDRVELHARAVGPLHAALLDDGQDGAAQVLAVAHAAGRSVENDSDRLVCHGIRFLSLIATSHLQFSGLLGLKLTILVSAFR